MLNYVKALVYVGYACWLSSLFVTPLRLSSSRANSKLMRAKLKNIVGLFRISLNKNNQNSLLFLR